MLLMEVNTLIPNPHVVIDITESMGKKRAAVDTYSTQLAKFPWGYYQRFGEDKARLRGAQGNCAYAEAFVEEPLAENSPFYEAKTGNLLRRK
jgi:LmbE family N-acetylglucosaminyl deacetylase